MSRTHIPSNELEQYGLSEEEIYSALARAQGEA